MFIERLATISNLALLGEIGKDSITARNGWTGGALEIEAGFSGIRGELYPWVSWFATIRWTDAPACPRCRGSNVQSVAARPSKPYRSCGKRF